MPDTLSKILNSSFQLFMRNGIRNTTMDDIARRLGISKKTLYEHVNNKAILVHRTVEDHMEQEINKVTELFTQTDNAIEEMVAIGRYVYRQLSMLNPIAIYEIRKYYPESWKLIEQHRNEFVYNIIVRNIENGMQQGLYRDNLKPDLIAKFYIIKSELLVDDRFYAKKGYPPADVYMELLKYHIFGIASEKGIHYLRDNMKKIKSKQYASQY